MCGIFGAQDLLTYEKLYSANCARGNFSGGSLYVARDNSLCIERWEGIRSGEQITGEYVWTDTYTTYLGHTQAPTGSQREFDISTTHPFEHGWFIVAHNGVLENHDVLRELYLRNAKGDCGDRRFNTSGLPVDSAVIPGLLDEMFVGDDVLAIQDTFSTLKGTFACWIYSKHTNQIYLVRSGSTLFCDIESGIFSSIEIPDLTPDCIDEGVIYCVTNEGLAEVGKFSSNSPFLIL